MINVNRWMCFLNNPVSGYSLAIYRIAFGSVMATSMLRFMLKGWVETLYVQPSNFFPFLNWTILQPLSEKGMYTLFIILMILAIGISLGLFFRFCAFGFLIGFTYVELLDKTNYLNHYYFVSIVTLLLLMSPAGKILSLDNKLKPGRGMNQIYHWQLLVIKIQICIVYFFAGIAKCNYDWLLLAQPLDIWFQSQTDFPWIGWLFEYKAFAFIAAWGIMFFELACVPLLFLKKTRPYTVGLLVLFHLITYFLFNIGMFPFIMLLGLSLFFAPDWPVKWGLFKGGVEKGIDTPIQKVRWIQTGLTVFLIVQVLLPLRFFAYDSNVLWSEKGMRFSWRVMLMEKTGHLELLVHDKNTGERIHMKNCDYLTERQEKMMATQPDMIYQFVEMVEQDLEGRLNTEVSIHVKSYVSLNGRRHQLFISKEVDLTSIQPSDIYSLVSAD